MSQNLLLKASGLHTLPNHLSSVPEGALLKANNVNINRDNIVESRRGFKVYGSEMATSAHQLINYKNRILRHSGSVSGEILDYDSGAGTFVAFKLSLTGDIINANPNVSNLISTSQLFIGMFVTGTGIPINTTILSITNNTSIVLSNNATATTVGVSLTFTFKIQEAVEGTRIKSIEQNGNLYFTTSEGIQKISVSSASQFSSAVITNAGGVKALDFKVDINNNSGFFNNNSVLAYRIVWGIKDANNNLILGTPSDRIVIRNRTGSSKTLDVRITIPREITTAYFYQIYRTSLFPDVSGSQDPGDEQRLVYEANPTTGDLTAGYVIVPDITPNDFRGVDLYTNQNTGEGFLQANDAPPLATDITTYKNYTFYSNTKTKQRLNLSLLSTLAVGTLTITDGTTSNMYTFRTQTLTCDTNTSTTVSNINTTNLTTGASISGADFDLGTYIIRIITPGVTGSIQISKAATATTVGTFLTSGYESSSLKYIGISQFDSTGQKVEETSRSLIRIINSQDDGLVNASYISKIDEVPGAFYLEGRSFNQSAFYLNVNDVPAGTQFSPNLPVAGSSVISTNEVSPNRIYYSKVQQPEAVPLLNYLDIGPKDKQIIRVLGLRDSLFILKEEGIYRLSGFSAPFQLFPFDFSTNIVAVDSAVILNNLIYLFSNQGITTISDNGVNIISRPIEDQIVKFLTPQFTNFNKATFGIAYESDRAYYLFTVKNISDTYATQCYRFNTFTNSWTIYDISKRSGIVNFADDKLYLAANDINYIEQERKLFNRTDFADREYTLSLQTASVNNTSIILPSLTNVKIYDVMVQTQYLTINQFNRLLSKLDRDISLSDNNYVSSGLAIPGNTLNTKLDVLITKIANDAGRLAVAGATAAGTYTALSPVSSTFSILQTTFNSLITLLNNDSGVFYSNYSMSSGTVDYEFPILEIDSTLNTITTSYKFPLMTGPMILYKHIATELQFVPQTLTDTSITKQATEGTFIFEDSSFTSIISSYSSDLSADFEEIMISGNGAGLFGTDKYGNGLYGGNGSGIPFRTFIPREKQRCRYINARMQHFFAREVFSLYGLSITFQPTSTRGWR